MFRAAIAHVLASIRLAPPRPNRSMGARLTSIGSDDEHTAAIPWRAPSGLRSQATDLYPRPCTRVGHSRPQVTLRSISSRHGMVAPRPVGTARDPQFCLRGNSEDTDPRLHDVPVLRPSRLVVDELVAARGHQSDSHEQGPDSPTRLSRWYSPGHHGHVAVDPLPPGASNSLL